MIADITFTVILNTKDSFIYEEKTAIMTVIENYYYTKVIKYLLDTYTYIYLYYTIYYHKSQKSQIM